MRPPLQAPPSTNPHVPAGVSRCLRYVAGSADFMHRSKDGEASAAAGTARSEKYQQFLAKWKAENVGADEAEAHKKWIELGNPAEDSSATADMDTA